MNNKENEYLLLAGKGNFRPLKQKFKELGGFYTGFCYVFPVSSEKALKEIIKYLPNIEIQNSILPKGQTLESYKQLFTAKFLKKKLKQQEDEFTLMTSSLALTELSEDYIRSLEIDEESKEELIYKLQDIENLKDSIEFAEGMAKAITSSEAAINIKFLSERDINFLTTEAPPMPRLVDYEEEDLQKILLRKGIPIMFCGAGGTGKTHSLTQLALCITSGAPWFDIFPIHEPGYVFLGLGENAIDDIHRLLKKTWDGIKKNNPFFSEKKIEEICMRLAVSSFMGINASFVLEEKSTTFYENLLNELKTKEPKEGWSCIILDPISRFLGAEAENDNAAATLFISLLEKMILDLKGNPSIIFGHHMNKSGVTSSITDQAAARGSSALSDGVRQQFNLEKIKKENNQELGVELYELNMVTLRMVKSNFTELFPAQKLTRDELGCLRADYKKVNSEWWDK